MKLIRADYIFIGSLLLLLLAHTTTNFLIKYYEDAAVTVGIAKEVAIQLEANPVARWYFNLAGFKYTFSYAIAPGLLSGLYWLIRMKYNKEPVALEAYAVAFFVIMLFDASNDVSLALGLLV